MPSAPKNQGALVVLASLLAHGKKCLAQALQRVKSQLVGKGRHIGQRGTEHGCQAATLTASVLWGERVSGRWRSA